MRFRRGVLTYLAMIVAQLGAPVVAFALPAYDHIVIVIEENQAPSAIIGSASAPYINSLAAGGANFNSFYSVNHPSHPNYFQIYSGSNQGITSDSDVPAGTIFTTPNLGAELLTAGKTFAGYFEDLPAVGSNVSASGKYVRRHNAVVNWQSATPGANQYSPELNQPFSNFPTDFSLLPTVSLVIPNNDNNTHDQPVAIGDAWLQNKLGGYATWAQTHNSMLIVTWDEDNFMGNNRIATLMYGQGIKPSQQTPTWTHHNLLRTIEDMYGTTHAGAAANVRPIVGPFAGNAPVTQSTARDTTGGYLSTSDTWISSSSATTNHGNETSFQINSTTSQALIRFDNIWGFGAGQAPVGARVLSAKLMLTSATDSTGTVSAHRMLANWTEASTWNTMVGGVSTDDVEAASTPEFTLSPSFFGIANVSAAFDVTSSVMAWAADPSSNKGWVLKGTGAGWTAVSSESSPAFRPGLDITYERTHWNVDGDGAWSDASNWISGHPIGAGSKAAFLRNITAPRTITMPSPLTVGSVSFESDVPYTISGTTLNLTGLSGVPTSIDVAAGSHTIAADVNLTETTPISIAAGSQLNISGVLNLTAAKTLTKSGVGVLRAAGGIAGGSNSPVNVSAGRVEAGFVRAGTTTISAGATLAIVPEGSDFATSKFPTLTITGAIGDWKGTVDLADNAMIIQADAATRLTVRDRTFNQIATGRNAGATLWGGLGITSSIAPSSDGVMGLGMLLNDNGSGGPIYNSFRGQPADINSILVAYTLVGDTDLDGDVDPDDFARIDAGFLQRLSGYWNGDLNFDGRIDADDFFQIDRAFGSAANQRHAFAARNVPEPGGVGVGALISAALAARGFRRSGCAGHHR